MIEMHSYQKIKRVHFIAYIMLFSLFTISSCNKDMPAIDIKDSDIPVKLTISTPVGNITTRSQTPEECAINEIHVLIFEDGIYKYRTQGNIVASTPTATTFTANLRSCPSTVKLYIVANATSAITNNEPAAGSSENTIKNSIEKNFTSNGMNQYFPMFGEYTLTSGLDATTYQVNTSFQICIIKIA